MLCPRLGHNISNCWYPKICSNLYFYKRVCILLVHYTLCMIFQINCYSKLYSINGPNVIVWLPLLLDISDNIWIVIICCPVCDVINLENNLIKSFFYITKKLGKNINILSRRAIKGGEGGGFLCPFLKIRKSALILEKRSWLYPSLC